MRSVARCSACAQRIDPNAVSGLWDYAPIALPSVPSLDPATVSCVVIISANPLDSWGKVFFCSVVVSAVTLLRRLWARRSPADRRRENSGRNLREARETSSTALHSDGTVGNATSSASRR